MKITTLLENKTTCDALRCEHGLSLYIETAKHKILFDSGASDAFWENAKALGIDLAQVDIAFLSHAHNDHCGGLLTFLRGNRTAKVYLQKEAFGDYYVVTPTKCAFIGLDPKLHEYADRFVMAEGVTKLDEELTPGHCVIPACHTSAPATAPATTLTPGCTKRWATASPTWRPERPLRSDFLESEQRTWQTSRR